MNAQIFFFKDIFFAIDAVKIDVTWSLSDLMSSELIIHVLLRRLIFFS